MDNKNVFVAIALSMAVLLFWGAFFETPRQVKESQKLEEQETDISKEQLYIAKAKIDALESKFYEKI